MWQTPMAFSFTPSGPPVWSNYPEKSRCVRAELDYSNGTQCFYQPPHSWTIIIIIFMCLAKSLIGRFQNKTMLHKEKNLPVIFLEKKIFLNQNTMSTHTMLNHRLKRKGSGCMADIPSLPIPSGGPTEASMFNSFSCSYWWLSLSLNNMFILPVLDASVLDTVY